ncbi:MAG: hypothetical protein M3364_09420 [Actinomycetota bacterium]|nr:hypothetical protein [Actinomycetota bacterium]
MLEAFLRRRGVGLPRVPRLDLDAGVVLKGELRHGVEDRAAGSTRAGHEDDAGAVTCVDDDVLGHGRAVEEVPRPQAPLLPFDEQQALTGEDEEVLLGFLAGVEPVRLPGLEDADPDPELGEFAVAGLEHAARAEDVVVVPCGISDVDDEPAGGRRGEPDAVPLEARFFDHPEHPIHANTQRPRC